MKTKFFFFCIKISGLKGLNSYYLNMIQYILIYFIITLYWSNKGLVIKHFWNTKAEIITFLVNLEDGTRTIIRF
jgi:hypothetical protein